MTSPVHQANYSLRAEAPVLPPASMALFKRIWRVLEKRRQETVCEDVRERLLHRLAGPISQSRAAGTGPTAHVFWASLRAITLQHVSRYDPQEAVCDEERVAAWLAPSCRWLARGYAERLLAEAGRSCSPLPDAVDVHAAASSPANSASPAAAKIVQQSAPSPDLPSPKSPSACGWALRWLDSLRAHADPSESANAWRSFLRAARKQRIGIAEWPSLLLQLERIVPEKRAHVISELVGRARPNQMMELWQSAISHLDPEVHHGLLEQLGLALTAHTDSQEVLGAAGSWASPSTPALIQALLARGHMRPSWVALVKLPELPPSLRLTILEQMDPAQVEPGSLKETLVTLLAELPDSSTQQILKTMRSVRAHFDRHTPPQELLDTCLQKVSSEPAAAAELAQWLENPSCPQAILRAGCRLAVAETGDSTTFRLALTNRAHGLSPEHQQLLWNLLEERTAQERGTWLAELFCLPNWTRRKVTQWRDGALEGLRGDQEAVAAFVRGLERASSTCRGHLARELARQPLHGETEVVQQRLLGCWLQLRAWSDDASSESLPVGWQSLLLPEEEWAAELISLHASVVRGCNQKRAPSIEADSDAIWADTPDFIVIHPNTPMTDAERKAVDLTSTISEVLDPLPSHRDQEATVDAAEESLVQLLVPTGLTLIHDQQIAVTYGCAIDRFALHLLDRLSDYTEEVERVTQRIDRGETYHEALPAEADLRQPRDAEQAKELVAHLVLSSPRLHLIRRLLAICWEHPDLALIWIADLAKRCAKAPEAARDLLVRKVAEEFSALDFELGNLPSRRLIQELGRFWALVSPRQQGAVGLRLMHQFLICELRRPDALCRRSMESVIQGLSEISLVSVSSFETMVEQWSLLKHLFCSFGDLLDVIPDLGHAGLAVWRRLVRQNFAAGLMRTHSAPTAQVLRRFTAEAIGLLHARNIRFTEILPISLVCEGVLNRAGAPSTPPPETLASEALDELLLQCLELPDSELESARDCWMLCLRRLWRTPPERRLPEEQMLMGTLMALLTIRLPLASVERMLAEFLGDQIAVVSDPALFQPLWQRIPLYTAGALRALRLMDREEGLAEQITLAMAPLSVLLQEVVHEPELDLAAVASDWRAQLSPVGAQLVGGYVLREASVRQDAERARALMRFGVNVMFRTLDQPLLGQVLDWLRAEHPASELTAPACPLAIFLHDALGQAWLGGGSAGVGTLPGRNQSKSDSKEESQA